MSNRDPVILVHGILGFGPKELGDWRYWGPAYLDNHPQLIVEASVGPLSSPHDRACELFAQIKGCQVYYGDEHSTRAGHDPLGTDYKETTPLYKEWSEENPIHLVGHSLGAPTIRCLQHLLEQEYWKDHPDIDDHPDEKQSQTRQSKHPDSDDHPDEKQSQTRRFNKKDFATNHKWIRSITTISGVNNGSTLTYLMGADEETGLVRDHSIVSPLLRLLALYTSATGTRLDDLYNFDLDHWGFEREDGESLVEYLGKVRRSKFMKGEDNALYGLTLQGAYADNARWTTYPDTHYFSYVTECTRPIWPSRGHYPKWLKMNPLLWPFANYIGHKTFEKAPPIETPFSDSDWWENDGMVPTFSQRYPFTNGSHPVGGEIHATTPASDFDPGQWYVQWERGMDHTGINVLPHWFQKKRLRAFYTALFERLAALPPVQQPQPTSEPSARGPVNQRRTASSSAPSLPRTRKREAVEIADSAASSSRTSRGIR